MCIFLSHHGSKLQAILRIAVHSFLNELTSAVFMVNCRIICFCKLQRTISERLFARRTGSHQVIRCVYVCVYTGWQSKSRLRHKLSWTNQNTVMRICVRRKASSSQRLCFPQPSSEWITGAKSPACSECYNRWASIGWGSRCHMGSRVKAGELCGTIAGWHQKSRREEGRAGGRGRRGEERLKDSAGTGGGVKQLKGISVSWGWGEV